jgi:hypothetical protein
MTYDADEHTVDCVAATQTAVRRHFGMEVLTIRRDCVDLSLLDRGRIPLLDSHDLDRPLGQVVDCWFANRLLYATLRFSQNKIGRAAEAMVARGELFHVSVGTTVQSWRAEDEEGEIRITNTNFKNWSGNREMRTFTALRWTLSEISLTTCAVDKECGVL